MESFASLEAQCAAIADDIAYNTHDIDDGLRAGLLTLNMLDDVPLITEILAGVRDRYPTLDAVRTGHELMRRQITMMVEDVIAAAAQNLREAAPSHSDDVRTAGRSLITFSPGVAAREKDLKRFLYANLYRHPDVMSVRAKAEAVLRALALHARASVHARGMARGLGRERGATREACRGFSGRHDRHLRDAGAPAPV